MECRCARPSSKRGQVRLRPILMTTLAMIFGMLPMAIGVGAGGELLAPMGRAVIGGVITSTLLTLLIVPVLYTYIYGFTERVKAYWRRGQAHEAGEHTVEPEQPALAERDRIRAGRPDRPDTLKVELRKMVCHFTTHLLSRSRACPPMLLNPLPSVPLRRCMPMTALRKAWASVSSESGRAMRRLRCWCARTCSMAIPHVMAA